MSPGNGHQPDPDTQTDATQTEVTQSLAGGQETEDPRLVDAVREYMAALETGRRVNRQEFISRYPEIAEELAACLDGLAFVHSAANQIHGAAQSDSSGAAAPPIDPATARPLGDFRLMREIGHGGMGVVYEAVQLSLGRRVAVKVLSFAAALDPRHLQRFRNEAQAAAQLHHTNIVPVYAVGCERGVHFYAMQLIEGQSLSDVVYDLRVAVGASKVPNDDGGGRALLGARKRLTDITEPAQNLSTIRSNRKSSFFQAVARIGLQAAEALDYAHAMGVVHRDIKPANLLLDVRGNLWITDFGLAQFYVEDNLTRTGDLLGTLRYMSPEQASGRAVVLDQRTDIYSLGMTLYELLTLERALPGHTREQLLYEIGAVDPKSPRSIDRSIPPELETILGKAVAKEPADRYPTARAMADDLQRFLQDKPILARPPSIWNKGMKWTRRHKSVAVSAVVVLVLAAAGLLTSTILIAHARANTVVAYKLERQRATEANLERDRAERSFRQARDVVDFFTRIGAQEMADKPESMDIRREMLEAALVYYQNFLNERQGDPSIGTELTAARSKVSSLLTELAATDEYFRMNVRSGLLGEPAVATELKLSDAQRQKADEINHGFFDRMKALGELRQLDSDQKQARLESMERELNGELTDLLTPAQLTRLRQIHLQISGPRALLGNELAPDLSLTNQQKEKIRLIQSELEQKQHAFFGPGGMGPPPGPPPGEPKTGQASPPDNVQPKPAERDRLQTQAMNQALAVLTPVQLATWKSLTGKPFTAPVFIHFHGFGPPGHHHEQGAHVRDDTGPDRGRAIP